MRAELVERGDEPDLLVWRTGASLVASTATVGGGVGVRHWLLNAQVPHDYARTDLGAHGEELASALALRGEGVVMFTAAAVRRVRVAIDGDVVVEATVGVTRPTWAAAPDEATDHGPGTVNIVVFVPVRLDEGAMLNAVVTATEAKSQALFERRIDGTGTASDALCVVAPLEGPREPFAGPRSRWGARVARAVHAAVLAGLPTS
ncbi:MAG: adenosylcobinamide amidohydrolase [Acidimicrobiales bacterium]